MHFLGFLLILCVSRGYTAEEEDNSFSETCPPTEAPTEAPTTPETPVGCSCGIFLSGDFKKGTKEPKGDPPITYYLTDSFPCTNLGNKQCTNKCLDFVLQYLHKSPTILCQAIDRDARKERAYLFIKNCKDKWINTNLSAAREYCCKGGVPYACPILS